jgi:transcriptional regulator with XRE-family HTH domain
MTNTQGLEKLKEFLAANPERSQGWLARTLDVSQPNVSSWLRGINRPGPEYRKALAKIASIPEDSWLTDDERTAVSEAQRRFKRANSPTKPAA